LFLPLLLLVGCVAVSSVDFDFSVRVAAVSFADSSVAVIARVASKAVVAGVAVLARMVEWSVRRTEPDKVVERVGCADPK
jgi:hypothetical protein